MRMCREILDVIEVWCRNLGLMLESEYRGDCQMLTLVFKRNSRDEQPYAMKFDLGIPFVTKEYIIERIKKDVKRRYDIVEYKDRESFYPSVMGYMTAATKYVNLSSEKRRIPTIKDVIFNGPATIVIWADDTKTVVKCQEGDTLDPEKGLAMAIAKKALGNKGNFNEEFKKWLPKDRFKDIDEVYEHKDQNVSDIIEQGATIRKAAFDIKEAMNFSRHDLIEELEN